MYEELIEIACKEYPNKKMGIHLAVFTESYIDNIFQGKKIIESRFSKNRISPYKQINNGDIVFIKKPGGDVVGYFIAKDIWYFKNLNDDKLKFIRAVFEESLCTDDEFWKWKKDSQFATMMKIADLKKINPVSVKKKNRSGWEIVRNPLPKQSMLL